MFDGLSYFTIFIFSVEMSGREAEKFLWILLQLMFVLISDMNRERSQEARVFVSLASRVQSSGLIRDRTSSTI